MNSKNCMQASCIVQHARVTVHRCAARCFLEPDRPVSDFINSGPGDAELLRGNVPQPEDWLRAWRFCRTPTSFHAAEAVQQTEAFIRGQGSSASSFHRKAVPKLIEVMAEVVRAKIRQVLRSAWSITISVDDRKEYRIVRFRCDHSGPGGSSGPAEPGSASGILAVLCQGGTARETSIEDFDEDYSQRMCDSILRAIDMMCTPHGGALDTELRDHIRTCIRHYVSDAGSSAKRCGHMLSQVLPNLAWCSRDPAHAVRIAVRDPLHAVKRFKEQWESLFNGQHALVPDIMNSEVWRAKLVACQRRVLLQHGSQGGGLDKVLRHLSFAKQRFDSYAEPLRKVCCLIRAIVMLLCHIATDARLAKPMRDRAVTTLQSLGPKELVQAGLTADYAAETLEFVRLFDCGNHDPAKTPGEVRRFIRRMRLLFCEGHILTAAPGRDGDDCAPKTVTQIVLEQRQDPEPIVYGDKLFVLWTSANFKDVPWPQFR